MEFDHIMETVVWSWYKGVGVILVIRTWYLGCKQFCFVVLDKELRRLGLFEIVDDYSMMMKEMGRNPVFCPRDLSLL